MLGLLAALTLQAARALADERSLALQASRAQVDVSRAGIEVARQLPNPTASASYGADDPKLLLGIDQKFPIFQHGAAVASAQAALRKAEATFAVDKSKLHAAVRRALFASWAAQRQAQLAAEAAQRAAELARLTEERFRTGSAPQLEVEQARLAALQAEHDREDKDAEARASQSLLEAALGAPAGEIAAPAPAQVPSDEALLNRAPDHPEIEALRREEQAALARAHEERVANLPLPDLSFTAMRFTDPNVYWGFRAGIAFDLPLLSQNGGRVREQEATALAANAEARSALQRITGELRASRARWAAAQARADFYQGEFLASATRVLEMAQAGYRIGRTSLLALLQAQNDFSAARSKAVDAALQAQNALADLEEATGADL